MQALSIHANNFIYERTPTQAISSNLWKIFKTTFLQNTYRLLPRTFFEKKAPENIILLFAGIFPRTFLQPVNGSKNSIWIEFWNSISSCFLPFLFSKHSWKIFHSIHLFLLVFSLYLQTQNKVVCIFLVNFCSKLPLKF